MVIVDQYLCRIGLTTGGHHPVDVKVDPRFQLRHVTPGTRQPLGQLDSDGDRGRIHDDWVIAVDGIGAEGESWRWGGSGLHPAKLSRAHPTTPNTKGGKSNFTPCGSHFTQIGLDQPCFYGQINEIGILCKRQWHPAVSLLVSGHWFNCRLISTWIHMNIIEVIHQLAHIWGHRGKWSRMDLEVGEFLGVELVDHFLTCLL